MSKRRMVIGLFLVVLAVAAAMWLKTPATHAATNGPEPAAGLICGKHHCSTNQICCPSCTTGELRCSTGPRCPECAPR